MLEFNEEIFKKKVTQEKKLSLVTFCATWCAPCQLQESVIVKLAKDFRDKAVIGRINVDENETLAESYGIKTLPTTLLFSEGELVETLVGFQMMDYLKAYLEHLLENKKHSEES